MATTKSKVSGAIASKKPLIKKVVKTLSGLSARQLEIKLASAKNAITRLETQLANAKELIAALRAKKVAVKKKK
jgi:soluble P-type ATPase